MDGQQAKTSEESTVQQSMETGHPSKTHSEPIPMRRVTSQLPQRERAATADPEHLAKRRSKRQSLLEPPRPVGPAPSFIQSLKSIILASYLNILLIFIPLSWAFNFIPAEKIGTGNTKDTLTFVFSFLAIIPLAKLLAFATDELSMRVGQTLAGLLNATLGNAVELIVAIISLAHCKLDLVQSSLIGSVLSNLLLVLGMCFFAGGLKYAEQGFGVSTTQLNSSLLTISVIAVLLPAAYHLALTDDNVNNDQDQGSPILSLSRGVSIILLFIYGGYLWFQLYSHASMYDDKHGDIQKTNKYAPREKKLFDFKKNKGGEAKVSSVESRTGTLTSRTPMMTEATRVESPNGGSALGGTLGEAPLASADTAHATDLEAQHEEDDEEEEIPQLSLAMCLFLLIVVTVIIAVTAEWLVDSIDGMVEGGGISEEFVGVILLPIVGNAAEHATAVTVAVKDKLTLSMGVAMGSSIQIALFVIPFIVTLAWIMGKPLTLLFDPYQSIVMFLSVLVVNYVVQDGKSNWLEGFILMCLYVILGVTFWFYPGSNLSAFLPECK
ncbi:calcium/proton exchanger [Schizophyllum commune H4-8]|uniref:Sodium/calcium exchanger membrane region domain-containing protein n=1 Tax=Schizophyllum commune (strain H4-8 / FGSC 9210) TaxID=578458 RepID=D8Q5R0_SCHCM|nr:calcium/proton exchanger [Schizophyllum commune H4-8]KAI5892071.1 calcium/proton exchanger [Schizophyllum commune H4-8]